MPVVSINITKQSTEKKAEISKVITEDLSRITSIPSERFIIMFNELPKECFAVGGELLSELHK